MSTLLLPARDLRSIRPGYAVVLLIATLFFKAACAPVAEVVPADAVVKIDGSLRPAVQSLEGLDHGPARPVGVVVKARNASYQPAVGAEIRVDLVSVKDQRKVGSGVGIAGPDGSVRLELPPPEPGAYKLLASAKQGDRSLGEGEDAVAVRAVGPELSDAAVRPELLSEIAKLTGGRSFQLPVSGAPDLPLLEPPVVEVGRSKDQPLWDRWYYLLLLVGLMGTEWLLRRRFGYV
jgi:hypothetical protein